MKDRLLAALTIILVPLLLWVGASAALGTYQWQRDHRRCGPDKGCLYRREHERGGLFHAWGSNFQAED